MAEAGAQKKTIEYARGLGYMVHRNYFGPGTEVGWPDVEIFAPRAQILLLEFKSEGKKPRKIQEYRIGVLRTMGHRVETVWTFEEAKRLIDELGR